MEITSMYENSTTPPVRNTMTDYSFSGDPDYSSGGGVNNPNNSILTANGTALTYNNTGGGNGSFYEYYDSYYDEYYYSYYLEIFQFELVTMGYIRPLLIFLTTITNVFVCCYFLAQKHRGKATNLLFISIAFSDTMTGVSLLPNSLGIYAADYTDISREWCLSYMFLRFFVSRVFHTVSVWQTVILSIQRYICVCHPFISGRMCTFWKTFISIGFSYAFAAILNVYHAVDNKLGTGDSCRWVIEQPCTRTCVYLWFSVVLQHLVPCFLLMWLTIKTLLELKKAQRRASTMSLRSNNSSRLQKDRIITITAILIVVCFLIPEFPHGTYKIVLVILQHVNTHDSLTQYINHVIICIYEIVLIISFNANFWIYCAMMHDFRRSLVRLVTCGMVRLRKSVSRLRSLSQSSRKSNVSHTSSNASRHRVFSRTTSLHSTTSDIIHHTAVIPLTPTKECDQINFKDKSTVQSWADDNMCDDVF